MQRAIRLGILRFVLNPKRRCPAVISRGEGSWWDTDCFSVRVNRDNKWYLLLEKIDGKKIIGKEWDGEKYSIETTIFVEDFDSKDLHIINRYGPFDISYHGYRQFIIGGMTQYQRVKHRLWLKWHDLNQYFYNQDKLVHVNRMELLRSLVNHHIEMEGKPLRLFDVMELSFTFRWINHPEGDKERFHMELMLDSLVHSGDLTSSNRKYSLTGKALETLSGYELEERRHIQQVKLSRAMAILTFVLIVVGLLQVFVK